LTYSLFVADALVSVTTWNENHAVTSNGEMIGSSYESIIISISNRGDFK